MKLFVNHPYKGKTELPVKAKTRQELRRKFKSIALQFEGYTFSIYDVYAEAEQGNTGGGAVLGGIIGLSGGTAGAVLGSFLGGLVGSQIEKAAVDEFNRS